jgi:pimeloyl-ACP methyl ester carboxylesterase
LSVLFVHGAWHGAWCWDRVLEHVPDGRAIDLPSDHGGGGFAADVAAVRDALDGMQAPVTLVGHSYGGAVVTEAGVHPSVARLVIVAGFALDVGETVMSNGAPPSPPTVLSEAMRVEDGALVLDPDGAHRAFYLDCDESPVDRLVPQPLDAFATPVTTPAWKAVPTTYVVCTRDQALHPDVQRFLAARCAEVVELEASHSPMLSMPQRIAEIARGATA